MVKAFLEWWLSRIDSELEAERVERLQRLETRIERLSFDLQLAEDEIASLSRQLEVAIDTIQAFGLHNRAIGVEAKLYTDYLTAKE